MNLIVAEEKSFQCQLIRDGQNNASCICKNRVELVRPTRSIGADEKGWALEDNSRRL